MLPYSALTRCNLWAVSRICVLGLFPLACGRVQSSGSATGGAPSRADTFARAAVVLGSCVVGEGIHDTTLYPRYAIDRSADYLWHAAEIPQMWGRFADQAECLANAGEGCNAVTQCMGYSVHTDPFCSWRGCSGDRRGGCGGSYYYVPVIDCASLGLGCYQSDCRSRAVRRCDESIVPSCNEAGEPVTCDLVYVREGPDCAALGLSCIDGACRGAGAACPSSPPSEYHVHYKGIACNGNTLLACVGGAEHERNCAEMGPGFSCREVEGATFCGLGSECMPANQLGQSYEAMLVSSKAMPVACEGTTVVFCNAGRIERMDCTELGFTGCDTTFGGCIPNFDSELRPELRP